MGMAVEEFEFVDQHIAIGKRSQHIVFFPEFGDFVGILLLGALELPVAPRLNVVALLRDLEFGKQPFVDGGPRDVPIPRIGRLRLVFERGGKQHIERLRRVFVEFREFPHDVAEERALVGRDHQSVEIQVAGTFCWKRFAFAFMFEIGLGDAVGFSLLLLVRVVDHVRHGNVLALIMDVLGAFTRPVQAGRAEFAFGPAGADGIRLFRIVRKFAVAECFIVVIRRLRHRPVPQSRGRAQRVRVAELKNRGVPGNGIHSDNNL